MVFSPFFCMVEHFSLINDEKIKNNDIFRKDPVLIKTKTIGLVVSTVVIHFLIELLVFGSHQKVNYGFFGNGSNIRSELNNT